MLTWEKQRLTLNTETGGWADILQIWLIKSRLETEQKGILNRINVIGQTCIAAVRTKLIEDILNETVCFDETVTHDVAWNGRRVPVSKSHRSDESF